MNRTPVKSSAVASVGHDPETNTLEVELTSGKVYRYDGVSAEEHAAFMNAESVGKHFGANIRGKYDHSIVEPEPVEAE